MSFCRIIVSIIDIFMSFCLICVKMFTTAAARPEWSSCNNFRDFLQGVGGDSKTHDYAKSLKLLQSGNGGRKSCPKKNSNLEDWSFNYFKLDLLFQN